MKRLATRNYSEDRLGYLRACLLDCITSAARTNPSDDTPYTALNAVVRIRDAKRDGFIHFDMENKSVEALAWANASYPEPAEVPDAAL